MSAASGPGWGEGGRQEASLVGAAHKRSPQAQAPSAPPNQRIQVSCLATPAGETVSQPHRVGAACTARGPRAWARAWRSCRAGWGSSSPTDAVHTACAAQAHTQRDASDTGVREGRGQLPGRGGAWATPPRVLFHPHRAANTHLQPLLHPPARGAGWGDPPPGVVPGSTGVRCGALRLRLCAGLGGNPQTRAVLGARQAAGRRRTSAHGRGGTHRRFSGMTPPLSK